MFASLLPPLHLNTECAVLWRTSSLIMPIFLLQWQESWEMAPLIVGITRILPQHITQFTSNHLNAFQSWNTASLPEMRWSQPRHLEAVPFFLSRFSHYLYQEQRLLPEKSIVNLDFSSSLSPYPATSLACHCHSFNTYKRQLCARHGAGREAE